MTLDVDGDGDTSNGDRDNGSKDNDGNYDGYAITLIPKTMVIR